MSDFTHSGQRRSVAQTVVAWFARLDDGIVLRAFFFVLLGGVGYMLFADFGELRARAPAADAMLSDPVLPAIDRPELDPGNPAFAPSAPLTADRDALRQPLAFILERNGVMTLEGTITPGSAERLAADLSARGEYIKTMRLNSPGGSVTDAIAIGRMIRDHGYETFVAKGDLCASSCPLVFAGGLYRSADPGAIFGVHQIFAANSTSLSPAQASSDAQETTAEITRYLSLMGIDPGLWLHALETPPGKLYYLMQSELVASRLISEKPPIAAGG